MSFWAGVASGFKDAKAAKAEQDELEARRADRREAFDYTKGQDVIKAKRLEEEDARQDSLLKIKEQEALDKRIKLLGSSPITGGSGSSSTGKSGTKTSLKHNITVAKGLGVSDDVLASYLGHGTSNEALSSMLSSYKKVVESYAGKPGDAPSAEEFFSSTVSTFTPGEEVTDEMVIAAAKNLGLKLEDMYGQTGSTNEDVIRTQLEKAAGSGSYTVDTPSYGEALDIRDVQFVISESKKEILSHLNQEIRQVQEEQDSAVANKLDKSEVERLATRYTQLTQSKTLFEKGADTQEAINKFGADVILPMIADNPSALGNNFGSFNKTIRDRTYETEADVLEAFKAGTIRNGSYYVLDGMIIEADGEGLASQIKNPVTDSQGKPNYRTLGEVKGRLDSKQIVSTGGEQGVFNTDGMSSSEIQKYIVNNGLKVGTPMIVGGKTTALSQASLDVARANADIDVAKDSNSTAIDPAYSNLSQEDFLEEAEPKDTGAPGYSFEDLDNAMAEESKSTDDLSQTSEVEPVSMEIPDAETMRKYNANLEAIIKQVPKDASREEKIDMILGAFMNSTPDLDPRINEDDLEDLITSALDQLEMIQ